MNTEWHPQLTYRSQMRGSIWPIAYNVLMDIEDVPMALREIRRVLRSTGTLVVSIVHPFADSGRFAGPEADAAFVVQDSYFGRKRFEVVAERDGLQMHFAVFWYSVMTVRPVTSFTHSSSAPRVGSIDFASRSLTCEAR
jgi:hypothetical protein